ncbi:MAG: hypothetical protein HUU06_10815 [Planctomycetaceae bacterium]|nr:hypothetical protein [Planctomycetota bacterium]NUN53259.1 hypothetical protein [Planctomycetaceae bacterium]
MRPFRPAAAALLALALLAAPGIAADEGPIFVPSLKKAVAMAKERGHPVLVWCVMDDDPSNKADQQTFLHKDVQRAMAGYLVVLGNHQDSHGKKDGTIDGKPAKVCALAPAITCADHKRAIDEVYASYADICVNRQASLCMPVHFVLDPDGKVVGTINNGTLASGFDSVPVPNMVKGLKELLQKAGGPGLTDAGYDEFQRILAAARTLVENDRMSEAAKALQPISGFRKNIALVATAKELLVRVDRVASAAFAKAKAALPTDLLGGLAGLAKVAEDFPGTESAAAALKTVEDFKGSPEGKKAMKEMARDAEGRAEMEKALAAAGADDTKALKALDALAAKYKGLPSGEAAAAKARAIREDPARMGAVKAAEDERSAKSALTLARGMVDGGKKDEAKAKLEEILAKWPGTAAAKEAAKLLEGLR